MDIKIPSENGIYKYIWVSLSDEDYVRFGHQTTNHEEMVSNLGRTLEESYLDSKVSDAGVLILNSSEKKMQIKYASAHYSEKFNPAGFKKLIEKNTEYKVEIPTGF
ncbi:MAG: hypothetical protein ABIH72_02085 [archaeon]